ncbi:hypothetical protein [Nocardia sp. NBC_00416]|uniref:hypothetical protein n=1 Tax=Nocardia sp. NBC_00416 TaxID=2975991 RepID=UPI002E250FC7
MIAETIECHWHPVTEQPGIALRHNTIDTLTAEQIDQLAAIGAAVLTRLDPSGTMADVYTRYDDIPGSPAPKRATGE